MKASIKIFTSDGSNKAGTYPIKLIVVHEKKTKRKIIARSTIEDWNQKDHMPFPHSEDFNYLFSYLIGIKKRIGSTYFSHISDIDEAFDYLLQVEKLKDVDFYQYANERIDHMRKIKREGNADAYNDAINELKKFKPKLKYSEITKSFIGQFKDHKKTTRKKNGELIKNTTIRAYLNAIKAIYNKCIFQHDLKDNEPFKNSFNDLKIVRRPKNIYIDKNSILKLESANLEVMYLQRTIDMILLQFYFCGADFTEIYHLKHSELQNNRAFIKRTKLGEKAYEFDFKVFDKAQTIIDKYKVKGVYVFPWRKDKVGYKTFMNNHRRDIKVIFDLLNIEVLPKHDSFTTKSIRHTFATIAKFERIDVDIIRELMGHERTDIDTVYKDRFPEAERDAAHWLIIDTKKTANPH